MQRKKFNKSQAINKALVDADQQRQHAENIQRSINNLFDQISICEAEIEEIEEIESNIGNIHKLIARFNTAIKKIDLLDQLLLIMIKDCPKNKLLKPFVDSLGSNTEDLLSEKQRCIINLNLRLDKILTLYHENEQNQRLIDFVNEHKEIIFNPKGTINLMRVEYLLGLSYIMIISPLSQNIGVDIYKGFEHLLKSLAIETPSWYSPQDVISLKRDICMDAALIMWRYSLDHIPSISSNGETKRLLRILSTLAEITCQIKCDDLLDLVKISKALITDNIDNLNYNSNLFTIICTVVQSLFIRDIKNKTPTQDLCENMEQILTTLLSIVNSKKLNITEQIQQLEIHLYGMLIDCYRNKPPSCFTNSDSKKIIIYINLALKKTVKNNYFQFLMGKIYEEGLYGMRKNIIKTIECYNLTISSVNEEDLQSKYFAAQACNRLGCIYLLGEYKDPDIDEAKKCFEHAIRLNPDNLDALANLATLECKFDTTSKRTATDKLLSIAESTTVLSQEHIEHLLCIHIEINEPDNATKYVRLLSDSTKKEYYSAIIALGTTGDKLPSEQFLSKVVNSKEEFAKNKLIIRLTYFIYNQKLEEILQQITTVPSANLTAENKKLIKQIKTILNKITLDSTDLLGKYKILMLDLIQQIEEISSPKVFTISREDAVAIKAKDKTEEKTHVDPITDHISTSSTTVTEEISSPIVVPVSDTEIAKTVAKPKPTKDVPVTAKTVKTETVKELVKTTFDQEKYNLFLDQKRCQLLCMAQNLQPGYQQFTFNKIFYCLEEIYSNQQPLGPKFIPIDLLSEALYIVSSMIKSESNSKIGLIQKNLPNIERLLENILLTLQQQNTSLNNIIDLLYKLSNLSIATAPHFDRLVDQLFKNIDDNIAKFTKQQLLQILSSGIKFKLNQNNKTILINVSKKLINIINDEAIDVNDHHKIDLLFSLATIDANYDLLNKIEFYDADLKSKLNNIIMALHKKLVNILQDSNKEFILSELGAPLLNKAYMALWYFQKALDDPQKKLFSLKELRPIKEFIKLNSTSQISISFFQDEVTKKIIESLSKSPKKILVENFIKTMPIDVVIMNPNKVKIPVQINGPVHFMFSSLVGSTSELPKTPKHVFHAKLLAKKNPSKLTRSRSRLWYLGKPKTSTKRGKSDIFTRLVKKLNYCLMLYRPFIDLLLKKP